MPCPRMPRPCAVVVHVCCYKAKPPSHQRLDAMALSRGRSRLLLQSKATLSPTSGCHGLAPWSFTFAATKQSHPLTNVWMPRPCAVVVHVCCYKAKPPSHQRLDATALRRGRSRLLLQAKPPSHQRLDATALRRGRSRLLLRSKATLS